MAAVPPEIPMRKNASSLVYPMKIMTHPDKLWRKKPWQPLSLSKTPVEMDDFLTQATDLILQHLDNERFGVSELAEGMHMSRSNLLRRVKRATGISASRFIRQVRLTKAMELLTTGSMTVSEVSHRVGFASTSYFIKCFRETYGYPPGEAGRRRQADAEASEFLITSPPRPNRRWGWFVAAGLGLAVVITGLIYLIRRPEAPVTEKSIVVLPFRNESSDTTNTYLINGLMSATLNHLQQIRDLRVVSRTSAEKYRYTRKSIPELAEELQVYYVVEGSGQKLGNRILLNIQLIDARRDNHLWARRYDREATDIFALQQEIARDIAREVNALITREEQQRIDRIPTRDLVAYDLFLKAVERMRDRGRGPMEEAISLLHGALQRDPEFALAYAVTAIAYYYLDVFQAQPRYGDTIAVYADRALLHDPTAAESLFAKGLYYVNQRAYEAAVPYLERAHTYNPNSAMIIHFLADFYTTYLPNTAKYLEYALQGMRLDPAANDSTVTSFNYLHLSNALVQTGFIDESLHYVERSLQYDPDNPFARWLQAVVVYAKYEDAVRTEQLLLAEEARDSTQLNILQELGKLYFHTGNEEKAFRYYQRFMALRDAHQLDIFQSADLDMAVLWTRRGDTAQAARYFARFKAFADNDRSINKHLYLALYDAYRGNPVGMVQHLRTFASEDHYQYWVLLFRKDRIVARYRNQPGFADVFTTIEQKFWTKNREIRRTLEEKGLL